MRWSPEAILRIVTVVVLLAVFGFAGYWWWQNQDGGDGSQATTFDEAAVGEEVPRSDEREVRKAAEDFAEYYGRALRDNDERDAERAKELLSERGRNVVELAESPVDGLRKFTLGLDAPEGVVLLEAIRQSEDFAELSSRWRYPNEALDRYFYLKQEEGEWKVDSVQKIRQ